MAYGYQMMVAIVVHIEVVVLRIVDDLDSLALVVLLVDFHMDSHLVMDIDYLDHSKRMEVRFRSYCTESIDR